MRYWTCRGCATKNPRVKQLCSNPDCSRRRPASWAPKHRSALDVPYEQWVERFGERCGICGRPPSPNRKLDRDHDHRTGEARGLLCHIHNRQLKRHVTSEWLESVADYLDAADGSSWPGDG